MSTALSLLMLTTFVAGEAIYEAPPFLEVAEPAGDELPANGSLYFNGSLVRGAPQTLRVVVNGEAHDVEFESTAISFIVSDEQSFYFRVTPPELAVGDDVVLQHDLLPDDVRLVVVEADSSPPEFRDGEFTFRFISQDESCDNPLALEHCSRSFSARGPLADDDHGVARYRIESGDGESWGWSTNSAATVSVHNDDTEACLRAVAVDIAGNEARSDVTCVDAVEEFGLGCAHTTLSERGRAVPGGMALMLLGTALARRRRRR